MKNLILFIALLALGTSAYGQRKKLSGKKLENALATCDSQEIDVKQSQHKQEFKLPGCGGTLKVKQVKSGSQKVPNVILRKVTKCSYVTIGTNGNFKTKNETTHYAMSEQSERRYGGSYSVKEDQVNFNGRGVSDNNVRMVLHSETGKTCVRVRVFLGNVFAN